MSADKPPVDYDALLADLQAKIAAFEALIAYVKIAKSTGMPVTSPFVECAYYKAGKPLSSFLIPRLEAIGSEPRQHVGREKVFDLLNHRIRSLTILHRVSQRRYDRTGDDLLYRLFHPERLGHDVSGHLSNQPLPRLFIVIVDVDRWILHYRPPFRNFAR